MSRTYRALRAHGWPDVVAALPAGTVWSDRMALTDLDWWAEVGERPGRRTLAERWSMPERQVRRLLELHATAEGVGTPPAGKPSKRKPGPGKGDPTPIPPASRSRPATVPHSAPKCAPPLTAASHSDPTPIPPASHNRPASRARVPRASTYTPHTPPPCSPPPSGAGTVPTQLEALGLRDREVAALAAVGVRSLLEAGERPDLVELAVSPRAAQRLAAAAALHGLPGQAGRPATPSDPVLVHAAALSRWEVERRSGVLRDRPTPPAELSDAQVRLAEQAAAAARRWLPGSVTDAALLGERPP